MARIDWVKYRLENWALWKERESKGGLGYAKHSSFLNEVHSDRYRESIIPIDDVDASLTNTAVESLRQGQTHLYMTLQHIYINDLGIRKTAQVMCKVESTIKGYLDQADHALSQWFKARAEQAQRQRSSTQWAGAVLPGRLSSHTAGVLD